MGDPRSFSADQEEYQKFLADQAWSRSRTRRSTCPTGCRHPQLSMSERQIYRFDEAEWHVPVAPGTDPEAAAAAGARARRAGSSRRATAASTRRS